MPDWRWPSTSWATRFQILLGDDKAVIAGTHDFQPGSRRLLSGPCQSNEQLNRDAAPPDARAAGAAARRSVRVFNNDDTGFRHTTSITVVATSEQAAPLRNFSISVWRASETIRHASAGFASGGIFANLAGGDTRQAAISDLSVSSTSGRSWARLPYRAALRR